MTEPATVLIPRGTANVLRALIGAGTAPTTIRQLSRAAQVSAPRGAEIIERLVEHGLATVTKVGGAKLCRFNDAHLAAPLVTGLVELRYRMFEFLRAEIADWREQPLHASLFGSAARGDGDTVSDLDILLIHEDGAGPQDETSGWATQLAASRQRVLAATGNYVSWFEVSRSTLSQAITEKEPIIDKWRQDNVHLAGDRIATVLTEASS